MIVNDQVSIIIPVFNRQDLIKDTLESVLSQNYQNWECIVVDDGSTDNTWSVLEDYSEKDSRIKILKRINEPKGAPSCRNIGANLSKSKYLIFWDSDDLLATWCITERINFMNSNPELDFGLFQLLNYSETNKYSLRCYVGRDDYLKRFLSFRTTWGTPAVIWRKSFYDKIGGWNEKVKFWQDGEVHIRALLREPKYRWGSQLPDGIIRDGIDKNSITTKANEVGSITNVFAVFTTLLPLLDLYYTQIFLDGIKAKIWSMTYSFSYDKKKIVVKAAFDKKLLSKRQLEEYFLTFTMYAVFKYIPFLKGVYYRLFIKPKVIDNNNKSIKVVDEKLKQELLRKVETLNPTDAYRKEIEMIINN